MKLTQCVLLFFLVTLLVACDKNGKSETDTSSEAKSAQPTDLLHLDKNRQALAGLNIEVVQVKSLRQTITVPGRVDFNQRRVAHLTSRVAGRVEQVYAFLGDKVQANTLLATVYSHEYLTAQSEFIQAEERLKQAEARRDSTELATAHAIYESARRKLLVIGATEQDLDEIAQTHVTKTLLEVRAPFTGTVTAANEIWGHFIEVGADLFHVADLSTLWVIVDIYEKDLPKIKPGIEAMVEVAAYPDERFTGYLMTIFDVLDEKTRTVKGRVEVRNPSGKLKPQMFATVTLQTGTTADMIVVPSKAVQTEGESWFVFVAIDDSSFAKRVVQPGRQLNDEVEITDGLRPGERIVTDGAFILKSEIAKATFGEE